MSAFEVNLTPTRNKTNRNRSEAHEPVTVSLGPFTPKAILTYEDVPVTKKAKRYLQIKNPEECELKLLITKIPKGELNFSLEWTSHTVEANSEIVMEIAWSPVDVVAGKETIQLTDNHGRKKDVSIIYKSIPLKSNGGSTAANSKRPLINKVPNVPKKLKLKSPSPPKHFLRKSILSKKTIANASTTNTSQFVQRNSEHFKYQELDESRRLTKKINFNPELSYKSPLKLKNLNASDIFQTNQVNFSNISIFDELPPSRASLFTGNKENQSPVNGSAIFDQLAFTPVNEGNRKNLPIDENEQNELDYLSSLPTPTTVKRSQFSFAIPGLRKKLQASPEVEQPRESLCKMPTPPLLIETNQNSSLLAQLSTPLATHKPYPVGSTSSTPQIPNISFHPPCFSTASKAKPHSHTIDEGASKKHLFETPPNQNVMTSSLSSTNTLEQMHSETYTTCTTDIQTTTTETKTNTFYSELITEVMEEEEEEVFHEMEEKITYEHQVYSIDRDYPVTITPQLGSLLSVIAEEDAEQQQFGVTYSSTSMCNNITHLQKTFNIEEKTLSEDNLKKTYITLPSLPVMLSAAKKPTSESMQELRFDVGKAKHLKFNQGSMPNLSENVASELNSIENNRYFYHDERDELSVNSPNSSAISTISTISTLSNFHENEIKAESSRFNLNDMGRLSTATTIYDFFGKSQTSSKENSPNGKVQLQAYGRASLQVPAVGSKRTREPDTSSPSINRKNKINKTSSLTISPPTRSKILMDFAEKGKDAQKQFDGKQIRCTNWSFKQPKKLKLSFSSGQQSTQPLILKKISTETPTKKHRDERIILYDAEMHLKSLINPDPFAATTTCDPFLASTMYLDERTIDRHEMQFKKWLNALVTIPPELDSNPDQKIDLGKLFNEVRNKELKLAPTKELVCSKYYRTRLDCLRKSAITLYMGDEMTQTLSKVALQVEKKLIVVRDDRNLHLDLVLQREILQLLLCFNPLWLRIGLEITFGEQLELQSNADVLGLSTFIINRMFKDRYLEAKYAKAYVYSNVYSEQIKKFMLKKFLFLLLFLDTAKQRRIIKQNPCLFVKTSPYKETKDILLRFSSHLLANVGDIAKHLRRFGYVLSHKQTYLDEYNYAFNNLAVDLRDGVRLTKVMEVILLREDLAGLLRVPAISRLQKVSETDRF